MGALDLFKKLHPINPYDNFDYTKYKLDIQGWNGEEPLFREYIDKLKPELIIEVGTWKGQSSIYMGEYIRSRGLPTKILCIDTWLGSIEHLTFPEMLNPVNGYPSIYYQFIANVKHKGLQDIITPFPQTSTEAARWLKNNEVLADMIYLDASHTEEDVYNDIKNYWLLLRKGGIMIGDDYNESYSGVGKAVKRFCSENNIEVIGVHKWVIRK